VGPRDGLDIMRREKSPTCQQLNSDSLVVQAVNLQRHSCSWVQLIKYHAQKMYKMSSRVCFQSKSHITQPLTAIVGQVVAKRNVSNELMMKLLQEYRGQMFLPNFVLTDNHHLLHIILLSLVSYHPSRSLLLPK
jgi:hypothetical protein